MALVFCAGCSTAYAVGASRCPHCGSTDHYEEGQAMPKITVHGGATNAAADPAAQPDDEPTTTPEEEPSPGNSSETSPEKQPPSEKPSAKPARSRALTTENPS